MSWTLHAVPEPSSRKRSRIFSKPRPRPPWIPKRYWSGLRFSVSGIDVHPVAVHLARSAWVLAAQPAIEAAVRAGYTGNLTIPIYLETTSNFGSAPAICLLSTKLRSRWMAIKPNN